MHDYSTDTDSRKWVHLGLGVVAFLVPSLIVKARTLFGLPISFGYPLSFGATFGILYFTLDKFLWKFLPLNIPNLNGKWDAEGVSSYIPEGATEPFRFQMRVTIKQTFSKIEIFTETESSTSRSTMASVCTQHAVMIFRYTFENTPKNTADAQLQRHPGLIELRINTDDEMVGDYFSGKHRLRYGELTLRREKI